MKDDALTIAGQSYRSRLLVGTRENTAILTKPPPLLTPAALKLSRSPCAAPTLDKKEDELPYWTYLPLDKYVILPNTAGCYDVAAAVRTLKLARELLDGASLVKLEVLGDPQNTFSRCGANACRGA